MTDKPLADVWATRDFPVLVEVTRRIDAGEQYFSTDEVAEALNFTPEEVERAARALKRRGLVEDEGSGMGRTAFSDVAGEAYFMTGLHPDGDEVLDRLISALEHAAEQAKDPEERGRLRRAAEALGSVTRDVAVNIVGAVVGVAVTS